MVFLDVTGRCGNQMFQYAFAKKISHINHDEKMIIDFYHVYEEGRRRNDDSFRNELEDFCASSKFTLINDGSNKIYTYGSKRQIYIFKIYTKFKRMLKIFSNDKRLANRILYKIMSHYGIYWYYAPEKIKKCKEENKFIWGYFENPKYFEDIADLLKEDFTPIHPEPKKNAEMYDVIQKSNSVCVSFRKWNENEPVNEEWFVCNRNYYQKALEVVANDLTNARLIIFSNDISWVKEQFDLPHNSIYEEGTDTIYEKMRLMYSCKHFVISNSTFAWWAQFLGRSEDKIVIAPEHWFKNEKIENPLIQNRFRKVSIE